MSDSGGSSITTLSRSPFERSLERRASLPAKAGSRRPSSLGAPVKVASVDLKVDAKAEPPAGNFADLYARDPEFKFAWERHDRYGRRVAPAVHERNLAFIAGRSGWSDQEIANLLIASRRKHGELKAEELEAKPLGETLAQVRVGLAREKELRRVSEQFAGFFLGQMLKLMRKTVKLTELGHGGSAERIFQELVDEEMGMEMGRGDTYSLGNLIYESLMRKDLLANQTATLPVVDPRRLARAASLSRVALEAKFDVVY